MQQGSVILTGRKFGPDVWQFRWCEKDRSGRRIYRKRRGAADSDGVIHLAFNRDFSQSQKNADNDREAIVAIGDVLLGSNRPFVITSGTAIAANVDSKPSTEDAPTASWNPRGFGRGGEVVDGARRERLCGAAAAGPRHTQAGSCALSSRHGA